MDSWTLLRSLKSPCEDKLLWAANVAYPPFCLPPPSIQKVPEIRKAWRIDIVIQHEFRRTQHDLV